MIDARQTGLCVPYLVQVIPYKGRGLFAGEDISRGSTVWRHVSGLFTVYDEQALLTHLEDLSPDAGAYLLEHMHCMPEFPGFMIHVLDEGELINHSNDANLTTYTDPSFDSDAAYSSIDEVARALEGDYFSLVATRDIPRGEELTLDYNTDPDDPPYYAALCEKYGISWDWME